jgi:hypothetical protein
MFRHIGIVCAGLLLCAVVGCTIDSFLVSITGRDGSPKVVSGSVDEVAMSLQAALSRVQIIVQMDRAGPDIRLAGMTQSGKKFTLVLRDQSTAGSRKTAVAVEWEGGVDEKFWGLVLEVLTASGPPRDPFAP